MKMKKLNMKKSSIRKSKVQTSPTPTLQREAPDEATANSEPQSGAATATEPATPKPLDPLPEAELEEFLACEKPVLHYFSAENAAKEGFGLFAEALYIINEKRLYRGVNPTFDGYLSKKFQVSKAHGYRFRDAGKIISMMKVSNGDILGLLTSESHFRPLAKLKEKAIKIVFQNLEIFLKLMPMIKIDPIHVNLAKTIADMPPELQENAIANLAKFRTWAGTVTPQIISSAITLAKSHKGAERAEDAVSLAIADIIVGEMEHVNSDEAKIALENVRTQIKPLFGPAKDTGISWTDKTWNPLIGCTPVSEACRNCWAAAVTGSRKGGVEAGLVKKHTDENGKISFSFSGKIELRPGQLSEPLNDKGDSIYFVGSMTDIFHNNVSEAYIDEIFKVMEAASWHIFQVLTKRPERMAAYTQKRYATTEPPKNIWFGTTVENQRCFDERYPHLKSTKAALKWLSVEPLLGPIAFESMEDIHWVVVGGEKDGNANPMKKEWVESIRGACEKYNVPFFFKQWGDFGEDGTELTWRQKKDSSIMSRLGGKIYHEFPSGVGIMSVESAKVDAKKQSTAEVTFIGKAKAFDTEIRGLDMAALTKSGRDEWLGILRKLLRVVANIVTPEIKEESQTAAEDAGKTAAEEVQSSDEVLPANLAEASSSGEKVA